jgi:hypothetical protein
MAIDSQFLNNDQLRKIIDLMDDFNYRLTTDRSSVEVKKEWVPGLECKELVNECYTHFVVIRAGKSRESIPLKSVGEVTVFLEVGSINEKGINFYKWVQRPVRLDTVGEIVDDPGISTNVSGIASEFTQRLRPLFPEFFSVLSYNVDCFETEFYGTSPEEFQKSRIDYAVRLSIQLRDDNPGFLKPIVPVTREIMEQNCKNSSMLDDKIFDKVDILVRGVMAPSKEKNDKYISWHVSIQSLTQGRKEYPQGTTTPTNIDNETRKYLTYLHKQIAPNVIETGITLLPDICTSPRNSVEKQEFVLPISRGLSKAFTDRYIKKLVFDPKNRLCDIEAIPAKENK